MKYIIRMLAAIPMLTVGVSSIVLFVFAFDYHWLVIPAILNFFAFMVCASHYEESVRDLRLFIGTMLMDMYDALK